VSILSISRTHSIFFLVNSLSQHGGLEYQDVRCQDCAFNPFHAVVYDKSSSRYWTPTSA